MLLRFFIVAVAATARAVIVAGLQWFCYCTFWPWLPAVVWVAVVTANPKDSKGRR